jgi:hypothetical protein
MHQPACQSTSGAIEIKKRLVEAKGVAAIEIIGRQKQQK